MAYLLQDPLNKAWEALYDRAVKIDLQFTDPQFVPFFKTFDAWVDRYAATYTGRYLTVTELETWNARLAEQTALVNRLASLYPQRTANGSGGKVIKAEDDKVYGALPWWYWPLRIGAGVGLGYMVYRTLRPGRASAFAGYGYSPRSEQR